ncbi:MAG: allophanate hydrolase subunit 1 [Verrucomicrobiota bacterium]
MKTVEVVPYGNEGLSFLLRWENPDDFHSLISNLDTELLHSPFSGLIEYVLGFQSLLCIFERPQMNEEILDWAKSLSAGEPSPTVTHQIPVYYEGPDLEYFSKALGRTPEEVIQLHSQTTYTVYHLGFAPGFPYLGPLAQELHLPRKAQPKTRIAPGSVAIGGSHTGIYTIESPGGWHVIGKTDYPLFSPDLDSVESFTLKAGDHIQFEPVK